MQSVVGNERLCPLKATALGACQVIPAEYPHIRCRSIDIDLAPNPLPARRDDICHLLAEEILLDVTDALVALRCNSRWTRHFETAQVASKGALNLRDGGHYLIIGGLGGIGFSFAEFLASNSPQVSLTLVGSSQLPHRHAWEACLSQTGTSELQRRQIEQVRSLEQLGARVAYVSADITDPADVRALASTASETFGRLHGIFHAAGTADGEPKMGLTADSDTTRHMAPKVVGVRLLEQNFSLAELDFVMLCSSVSAIAPTVGQMAYAAANAFLDAFAHERTQALHANIISVNWSSWQRTGITERHRKTLPAELRDQMDIYLENCISVQDSPPIFALLLACPRPQVMVSPVSIEEMLRGTAALNTALRDLHRPTPASKSSSGRPRLAVPYMPPRTELERSITDIWEDSFGINPIGVQDGFFDLGGHSLLATQIVSKLRIEFKLEMPLQLILDSGTVEKLAVEIDRLLQQHRQRQDQLREARNLQLKKQIDSMSEEQLIEMLERKERLNKLPSSKDIAHE
jgi:iturin family lipopeptide synthetase A